MDWSRNETENTSDVTEMCIRDRYDTYVNAVLSEQALDGNSLMTAYLDLNEKLDETGIEYESLSLIHILYDIWFDYPTGWY